MKIATACSSDPGTQTALEETIAALRAELGGKADLILLYYTENHATAQLSSIISEVAPDAQVHGTSTCLGTMDNNGFHGDEGSVLGAWALSDPGGAYGSALVTMNSQPRRAGAEAIQRALTSADRAGEIPDLIWLNATPGHEEEIIAGIQDIVGPEIPIIGGSAADNRVAGRWSLLANGDATTDGVAVSVMFPSVEISYVFQSGYSPTSATGTVTKADGRTVYEIDGRPAAEAYNEWSGGIIEDAIGGGNVLALTTFQPLGRKVASVGQIDYYKLSHPDSVTPENALTLFSEVSAGDELVLMTGSKASLISRAGRLTKSALDVGDFDLESISGALMVFCAGCMLAIRAEMGEVATAVDGALKGKPFISAFTFGEQGCFFAGGNSHGNLMISMVVFDG